MFALVDCNNFYASCERVFRPDLIGKPIVVLSNNDGCVIARSNEAKELGIPMGAPAYQYDNLFEQHNVQVFSANFALYGDISNRVMSILSEYSPEMEIYSIDECFIKLEGYELYNLQQYGEQMRKKVMKWTGIPISVGIAPTKTLSKLANRIAKKYPTQTAGCYIIDNKQKRLKALKWLKIEDVWGIGRQHSKLLKSNNITTAHDFTQLDDTWVRQHLTIVGLRLKHELQGIPTLELEEEQVRKSIATTRTFETLYTQLDELTERIITFVSVSAEKLRKQQSLCNMLTIFIGTNSYNKKNPQYNQNITIKLPYPTNSTIELSQFAKQALLQIFQQGYQYKKAGVILQNLTPENIQQYNIFDNRNEQHIPLMKTIDNINAQFGQQKVRLASQDTTRVWKMKQQNRSPRYTTDINEIITIKA